MRNVAWLTILDDGCVRGDMALEHLKNGAAKVCAIDISSVYVADGEPKARNAGFAPERFDFQVNSFDSVAGWSSQHHLDADTP